MLIAEARPVNYGFVIDNTRCIGCHACSTACKSENEVPLGVHRTWVKYVEHGAFPDVTRTFQVTRCNHCANPPCVRICPVTAMYQREDGIVEFDKDVCIGCKACMQACPYDAIHIDPDTHTAAKCHYCSHRVDAGLEPACAVVCPTEAIITGDLDDPMSRIAKTVAANRVTVRKPEQGTAPKVLYIDGDHVALHPTVFAERPRQMMFSETINPPARATRPSAAPASLHAPSGAPIREPQAQAMTSVANPAAPRRHAEQMVQLAYNAQHKVPWHWPVPAYLVTKALATGIMLMFALAWGLGLVPFDPAAMVFGGALSILMTLVTTALLVFDLERPERFMSILLHPQWKSWLTRGAFLLVGFATISSLWWLAELLAWLDLLRLPDVSRMGMAWLCAPLAVGAAIYTAFLFAQAEGRDLWQSPLLPVHLLIQAVMVGGGALLGLAAVIELDPGLVALARIGFGVGLALDLFMLLFGEFGIPHASEVAALAAREISKGKYAKQFWLGAIVLGHLIPMVLLLVPGAAAGSIAALLAIVGLYAYEHAFVMAPQEIPNS